jgi:hypothetical protein
MIKLKYRIQKIQFPSEQPIYVSQYRFLGVWLNIGISRGHFFKESCTYCGSIIEAKERVKKHKALMSSSGEWANKKVTILDIT